MNQGVTYICGGRYVTQWVVRESGGYVRQWKTRTHTVSGTYITERYVASGEVRGSVGGTRSTGLNVARWVVHAVQWGYVPQHVVHVCSRGRYMRTSVGYVTAVRYV